MSSPHCTQASLSCCRFGFTSICSSHCTLAAVAIPVPVLHTWELLKSSLERQGDWHGLVVWIFPQEVGQEAVLFLPAGGLSSGSLSLDLVRLSPL